MSDYAIAAEVVSQEDVNALLSSIAPDADVDDEYEHFLQPGEEQIKALVAKYWDNSYIRYGADAPDFPLCYDFAELCAAKVREACIREGMKYRIAFGTLRYTMNKLNCESHERHAICFVVLNNCHILYYEPQDADTKWMNAPQDCKSLDSFEI